MINIRTVVAGTSFIAIYVVSREIIYGRVFRSFKDNWWIRNWACTF